MPLGWQSDLINTNESVLPVWDKPFTRTKEKYRKGGDWSLAGTMHCYT